MSSLPPGVIIASAVVFFGAVLPIEILNVGGVRGRLAPNHDRFLKRLPSSVRLAWFAMLLVLGALYIGMLISPGAFASFLEAPIGQITGALVWITLILVFVRRFSRNKQ